MIWTVFCDLAVATFNCQDGIAVGFFKGMLSPYSKKPGAKDLLGDVLNALLLNMSHSNRNLIRKIEKYSQSSVNIDDDRDKIFIKALPIGVSTRG